MSEIHPTICRVCAAHCGILVEVEDGRVVSTAGDRDNPLYRGYICPKGRTLPEMHNHAGRLLRSMKRVADDAHTPIAHGRAIDEIAAKLQDLLDRHGPRSIALYAGTYAFMYPVATPMAMSWMNAIGSPMRFAPATIDKSGKGIAMALHGRWAAGPHTFAGADTWMIVGANPPVSRSIGAPPNNGSGQLHNAVRRGMKLIVIDPRQTEAARLATVHLQGRPGQDPAIIAGMLRLILHEGLADRQFVEENAHGLEQLARAVEPFTPELVEQRADVPAESLLRAARLFAAGPRGFAVAGTGPNMAPRGTLSEYLLLCLNTVCGRWLRAGERVPNPGVLTPTFQPRAQAVAPTPGWGFGEQLRVRGLGATAAGLPTAALPDEILLEGEGRVRALICVGGNPAVAWPDQQKTVAALKKLELLVSIDTEMSATARLSHYVIAPKLSLEQPGHTYAIETLSGYAYGMGYEAPYAQYARQLVEPPPGADVIEDWELFYGLAQRMGLSLSLETSVPWIVGGRANPPVALDMRQAPTTEALLGVLAQDSRIALEDVRAHPHGHVFEDASILVQAGDPASTARLELANAVMLAELDEVACEVEPARTGQDFRLVPRRMADVYNSFGRSHERLVRRYRYNPAYLHPEDLAMLAVASGDLIEIRSDHDTILAIAEADASLRRGLVSITHAFGDLPEVGAGPAQIERHGSNIGRLVATDRNHDPYCGIPWMSAVPVSVSPHRQ